MTDIRDVLSLPWLYRAFQSSIGARDLRSEIASRYIKAEPGDRILDIGCGTADIRSHLGDVAYVGFDPSQEYIESARLKYPDATFHVGSVKNPPRFDCKFDIALAIGVLHHVADEEAAALFELASALLSTSGKLITLDPVVVAPPGNYLANLVVRSDRGRYVRTELEYTQLAERSFPTSVKSEVRGDLIRLPYNHCVLICG